MLRFLLKRLALTIPTFVALMFVTFVAIRMVPGDPVEVRTGERGISPERLEQFRHEMGLDQPVWKQFADYAWGLLHGDFGTSVVTNERVLTEFLQLFPATLELAFFGMVFAILIGIPAGVIAALDFRSNPDGPVADRLFDADFLVGSVADHAGVRTFGLDAGVGSH
jgi:dipeptide transport system permease protein